MIKTSEEQSKLDKISNWYSNQEWGFYTKLVTMGFRTIKPYFRKGNVLEVGSADGEMTKLLLEEFKDITVVDGAKKYIDKIRKLDPKIKTFVSLIEDFKSQITYDNIIFAHVLEHVINPQKALEILKSILSSKGRVFIIVPNALSLHRQVGVKMGLLKKVTDLNDADISVDHKRVYTPKRLQDEIKKAGLKILKIEGIFLKPISNQQLSQWDNNLIEGYYKLGKEYPEIASEIAVICCK